jgi:hypothetical protein
MGTSSSSSRRRDKDRFPCKKRQIYPFMFFVLLSNHDRGRNPKHTHPSKQAKGKHKRRLSLFSRGSISLDLARSGKRPSPAWALGLHLLSSPIPPPLVPGCAVPTCLVSIPTQFGSALAPPFPSPIEASAPLFSPST